jgi:hypothetical protein
VVINEVLPFPQSQWNCTVSTNDGSNRDNVWIEIYNPQDQPFDLYAAHASIDQGPGTASYILHLGSIISAHGFLVVFPFHYSSLNAYTQFPPVRLLISQTVIDAVSPPTLLPDTSYARIPDGSNNWQIMTIPTIGNSNQYITETEQTRNDTRTQSHTTKQKSTKKHSGSASQDETSTDTSNAGVQPTWSALRLPSPQPNTSMTQQHNSALSAAPSTDSFDLLKKTLLTLLIAIVFSALLWGWRLYRKKDATKLCS